MIIEVEAEQSCIKGTLTFVVQSDDGRVKVTVNHSSQVYTDVHMSPAEAMQLLGAVEIGEEVMVVKTITIGRAPTEET